MSTPEWITQNAEALGDLASNETLTRYTSIPDLAKGLVDTKTMVGSRLPIPTNEAGKETWDEFYTKLDGVPGITRIPAESDDADGWKAFYKKAGAPDSPDDYKISADAIPEGVQIDEELLSAIRPAAHARGVTNNQLNGLFETMSKVMADRAAASQQGAQDLKESLKQEWGQAFEAKQSAAIGVAKRLGGEDFAGFIDAHGEAALHPGLMKTFAAIAEKFSEDPASDIPQQAAAAAMTPEDARLLMAEIRSNPDHPFRDARADQATKVAARVKMYELQCFAMGQKPDPEQIKFLSGR